MISEPITTKGATTLEVDEVSSSLKVQRVQVRFIHSYIHLQQTQESVQIEHLLHVKTLNLQKQRVNKNNIEGNICIIATV